MVNKCVSILTHRAKTWSSVTKFISSMKIKYLTITLILIIAACFGLATSRALAETGIIEVTDDQLAQDLSVSQSEKQDDTTLNYVLGPGDELDITVFNQKDLTGKFKISEAGSLDYPFIGKVQVAGQSIGQVQSQIQTMLAKDYLVNPQVQVSMVGFRSQGKIYVSGAVKSPGAYNFEKGITALNAIILAGGFTDVARPNKTKIVRGEKEKILNVKVNLKDVLKGKTDDVTLAPGDRIIVPESVF